MRGRTGSGLTRQPDTEGTGGGRDRDRLAGRLIAIRSRLEQIDRRRQELARRIGSSAPGPGETAPTRSGVRQSQDAMLGAWQNALRAFETAAEAHDQVADRYEELARLSIGDRNQCLRRAADHRQAAGADRRRAEQMRAADGRRAGRYPDQV